jgi:hypothetical protein
MKRHTRLAVQLATIVALAQLGVACGGDDTGGGGGTAGTSSGGAGGSGGQSDGSAQGGGAGTGGVGTGGAGGGSGGASGSTDGGRESGAGTGGAGGILDSGGVTDSNDSGGGIAACNPVPVDNTACTATAPCSVSCGVNLSALTTTVPHRTCTCGGGGDGGGVRDGGDAGGRRWSCPSGAGSCAYPTDVDLTCLMVPASLDPCPRDPTADGGADGGGALIRTGLTACTVPSSETCGSICGSAMPNVFSYQTSAGTPTVGYCVCIGGIYQCATVNEWYTP